MANDARFDYSDILGDVQWDLDKARYLLNDLQNYFECPDLEFPPREKLDTIHYEFKHIAVIVGLLKDMVDKVDNTIAPLI